MNGVHGGLRRAAPWIVLVAALAAFGNALNNGLVYDARFLVTQNETFQRAEAAEGLGRQLSILLESFREEFWAPVNRMRPAGLALEGQALYRPCMMVALGLVRLGFGVEPLPYHLLNLLFHALASVLVFFVAMEIVRRPYAALMAGLLFAVHPLHSEAVAYVAGLGETQSACFGLAALLVYLRGATAERVKRGALLLAGILFALSVFTKESGALALVLLVIADFARGERAPRGLARLLGPAVFLAVVLLNVWARHEVVGSLRPDERLIFRLDNPLVNQPFETRLATGALLYTFALRLFVLPIRLSADYSFDQLPVAAGFAEPAAAVALLSCALLFVAGLWALRKRPLLGMGLLSFLLAFGPVSNVLFPIGTIFGERLLYLPSVGLCLAAGALLQEAFARLRQRDETAGRVMNAAAIAVVLALGARAAARNPAYASNEILYDDMTRTAPRSARAHFQAGEFERSRTDQKPRFRAAINSFRRAIEILPEFLLARLQLGYALAADQDVRSALAELRELRAMTQPVESLRPFQRLVDRAIMEVTRGVPGEAGSGKLTIDELIRMTEEDFRSAPDDPAAALRLVPLYAEVGRTNDAERLLENGGLKEADPLRHDALKLMLAAKSQRLDEVRTRLAQVRAALEGRPEEEVKDVLNLVRFYGAVLAFEDGMELLRSGRRDEARKVFEAAAADLDAYAADVPEDWQAYRWRGQIRHRGLEQLDLAFDDYQRSVQLNPKQGNEIFLWMHQCMNAIRRFDAQTARFSEETEKLFPDDAGVKMLRAQMLSGLGRHDEAAQKAREAIRLGLTGALAYSTLAKELAAAGKVDEALATLNEALGRAPHPDYENTAGSILFDADRPQEALPRFEAALELARSDPAWAAYVPTLRFQIAKTKLHVDGRQAQGFAELQSLLEEDDPIATPRLRGQRDAFALRWIGWAKLHVDGLLDRSGAASALERSLALAREHEVERPDLEDIEALLAEARS